MNSVAATIRVLHGLQRIVGETGRAGRCDQRRPPRGPSLSPAAGVEMEADPAPASTRYRHGPHPRCLQRRTPLRCGTASSRRSQCRTLDRLAGTPTQCRSHATGSRRQDHPLQRPPGGDPDHHHEFRTTGIPAEHRSRTPPGSSQQSDSAILRCSPARRCWPPSAGTKRHPLLLLETQGFGPPTCRACPSRVPGPAAG